MCPAHLQKPCSSCNMYIQEFQKVWTHSSSVWVGTLFTSPPPPLFQKLPTWMINLMILWMSRLNYSVCLACSESISQESRPPVIFPDIKYPNSCFQALVGVRGSMPSPRKIWFPVRKGHESDVLAGNGQKWGEYDICHEGFGQPRKLVNRGWHHELTWYMWCVFINAGETMKYHSAPLCTPPGSHIRSSRQHTPVCMHNAAESPPTILKMRWDR